MKSKFIPIDYDYFDIQEKNYIKIYGRDENHKKICIIDSCSVYLWAILNEKTQDQEIENLIEEIKTIEVEKRERKTRVEKIELKEKNYLGEEVKALKIYATNYKDLQDIASKLDSPHIAKRRGYDLGFITTYIIEKQINPLTWYEIEGEVLHNSNEFGGIDSTLDVDFVIKLNSKKEVENQEKFNPKVLGFDIETDSLEPHKGEILMISLYGKDFKKVITWKKSQTDLDYVEFVENEKELLEKFSEYTKEYSPDFLIGYNSDNFDMPFIKERAKILKTRLKIGLDNSEIKISRGTNLIGKVSGITHIDLIKFIRTAYSQYMQSETLSLNEVSKEFLKNTKKEFKIEHSSKLEEKQWEKYYEYNLHDSVLVFQLFEKFWPDILEFSKIIKEPPFDISRNGLSKQIESYILHNLERYNEIPERRPSYNEIENRKNQKRVEGAFVYEPTAGLYENLAMFDFTSMHTSIIITHNLSKENLTEYKENSFKTPDIEIDGKPANFYFSKTPGFFPQIIQDIFNKRKQFKSEYKKNPSPITLARSNAFKVLSASAHGYIGFSGARYYSWEASSAILAFVRKYNKETIQKIENAGHKVIYGDTDSVALTTENKSKKEIKELLEKLNNELPGVMHLELEDFFKRGLWVTTRTGQTGAKKKYALIDEDDKIKIRGFETVRRDWCQLARKTQNKILELVLENGNEKKALEYLKNVIKKLKTREISKDELIIKSQLKKPLEAYKAISPHVVAARKMKSNGVQTGEGTLVKYYIAETQTKSKLVRDKVKLPEEEGQYDIEYYLEKQIIPSCENILQVFNVNIKEIIEGKKQENLNKWF